MARLLVGALAGCSVAVGLTSKAAPEAPEAPPMEVLLEYREAASNVGRWGFNLSPETKPFAKEPDIGSRKVTRGTINFGLEAGQELCLLWDFRQGKLYVDLNRNRDLTDDPEGVFTAPVSRYTYSSQLYTNVHLQFKTPAGTLPVCLDLSLYGPERDQVYCSAQCRSWWEGKVTLGGREWQVGRIDSDSRGVGEKNRGYLLLRPWDERGQPFEVQSGLLDTFTFPHNLFFGGQAYRLDCAPVEREGKSVYKLSFQPTTPALGEVQVTGKFLHRLLLATGGNVRAEDRFTVVLDRPEGLVKVPPGQYGEVQAQVRSGKINVYRDFYGQSGQTMLNVAADAPSPVLVAAGGPLTNSVSAQRRGRDLSLQYQLVGADGARYSLFDQDRSHPPRFVIHKNGKEVHAGKFEFG